MSEIPKHLVDRIEAISTAVAEIKTAVALLSDQPPETMIRKGVRYRRFERGDTIQHGDMFLRKDGKLELSLGIGYTPENSYSRYFRPIVQPDESDPDVPEGYRRLTIGVLQEGDVYKVDGRLVPTTDIGLQIEDGLNYFRPITAAQEPVTKPRRSPVEVAEKHLRKYDTRSHSAAALRQLIEELQQERYE